MWYHMKTGLKNNKGFTLVELIVVIAIMAVLTGFIITGIGLLSTLSSRQCARQLKQSIGQARIETMGKNYVKLRLYKDSTDNCYYLEETKTVTETGETSVTTDKVGSGRITITGKDAGGSDYTISTGHDITLSFKRSTGGFDDYVKTIVVSSGGRDHELKLMKITGRVEGN